MLVLTRRESESVLIDGRVKITVVRIRGNQIRLGIEAPRDVPVVREELVEEDEETEGPLAGPRLHAGHFS